VLMVVSGAPAIAELSGLYYPLFRGLFLLASFACMYGVLLFVWKRSGIDYASILSVPAGRHNYHAVLRAGVTLVSLNFIAFSLFFLTLTVNLTPNKNIWPAAAILLSAGYVLAPVDWMPEWQERSQRASLGRAILRVLASPFSSASFEHSFIADVFCSMPKLMSDLLFTGCIYATGEALSAGEWNAASRSFSNAGPSSCADGNSRSYLAAHVGLSVLPFWLRLMQCARAFVETREQRTRYRHAANGVKYICSISVVLLSFLSGRTTAWLLMSALSTVYAAVWDVVVDWGLGPPSVRHWVHGTVVGGDVEGSWLLRPVRAFPDPFYRVAVGLNTCARLGWAIYISPGQRVVAQHVTLVLGTIELLRRAQWALLRVEWEQIKTAAKSAFDRSAAAAALLQDPEARRTLVAEALEHNKRKMRSTYGLPVA
jgi:hypothetical protein